MLEDVPQDRRKEYQEAFEMFDVNKDGSISKKELEYILRSLNEDPEEEEIQQLLDEVDVDGNGEIDFEEFVALMGKRQKQIDLEAEIVNAFKVFDKEENNLISITELRHILSNLNDFMTEDEIDDMLFEADSDYDGFINYKDFLKNLMSNNNS
jgi:calmodulin